MNPFMELTLMFCSVASQAVREVRKQESRPLELPQQPVLSLSYMDPDLLRLPLGLPLWALPLLLLLDYHAGPRDPPGPLLRPVC